MHSYTPAHSIASKVAYLAKLPDIVTIHVEISKQTVLGCQAVKQQRQANIKATFHDGREADYVTIEEWVKSCVVMGGK